MKHTPGPWEVKKQGLTYIIYGRTSSPFPIASTGSFNLAIECFRSGIDEANACLIGSAPTTLAWLKWVRDTFITIENYPADVTIHGLTLDQVITKAEGQE